MVLTTFLLFTVSTNLPPGAAKPIVQQHCGGCHALKVVTSKRASKQQWASIVDQMVSRGAEVDDDDIESVVEYLAANFAPAKSGSSVTKNRAPRPVNVNTATAAELTAALGFSAKESAAVVSYREQNGGFKQWTDLAKVPGLEARKVELNKNRLQF
jgi:competence ComEA-like helix-hairpin-helix protein